MTNETPKKQINVTPKLQLKISIIGFLISLLIPFGFTAGDLVFKKFTSDLVEKECTAVDIYTVVEFRREDMFTVFRDEDGNEYKKRTTVKDYVGRKVVLSTHGTSGYRNGFELMKPSDLPTWTLTLMPVFLFISLIYYIIKAFRFGLDGSRAPAGS